MKIAVNDVITLKKQHPCGTKDFIVLRIGSDMKVRCTGCSRELMIERVKLEKMIKRINGEQC